MPPVRGHFITAHPEGMTAIDARLASRRDASFEMTSVPAVSLRSTAG
jgi:hypothetical protein